MTDNDSDLIGDVQTMKPEDIDFPANCAVFIIGDRSMALAYIGNPDLDDRLRSEAIYRLITETSGDAKKMNTAVIRGIAMLKSSLH